MPIHTVRGPIAPEALGRTSMHEHVFNDGRVWYIPAREPAPERDEVTMENLGFLRWNLLSLRDNLVLEDPDLAVRELEGVKAAGGSGFADLTVSGMGRRVAELVPVSERSGLHIMVGCGFYIHDSHPAWVEDASIDDLVAFLIAELTSGIDDTGILPALIGEIGTGSPVTARERKAVIAAGRAGAETGAAVNIHLDPRGAHALELLELLTAEGMSAERVVFSHMDERLDWAYHAAVADAGAVLEYDTFGAEAYLGDLWKDPTDDERMEFVGKMLDAGYVGQFVWGCDVWIKTCLRAYGGMGYDHLLKRIVPELQKGFGVDDAAIERILVTTPRRLLDRAEP